MDLAQIKRHPNFPFRRFRENGLEFLLLEQYWIALFRDAVGADRSLAWTAAFPADRHDGNPILFLVDRTVAPPRYLRIVQSFNERSLPELDLEAESVLPREEAAYVAFMVDITENATDSETLGPAEELLIFSDLTPAGERLCRRFIAAWCVERVSEDAMDAMARTYRTWVRSRFVPAPDGGGTDGGDR